MNRTAKTIRRGKRTRAKIKGTNDRPRLSVYRSNEFVYAQLIDDAAGKTLFGVSEKHVEKKDKQTKIERAKTLGIYLAEQAKSKGVKIVTFDRGSYKYHGRVKAFAEGAREGGLEF